jgi:hypothetical protein
MVQFVKFIIKQSKTMRFLFLFFLSLAVWGCLTDGANHAGNQFLKDLDISFYRPLDSVEFTYPIDSFRVEPLDGGFYDKNIWYAGRHEGFIASTRMGFELDSGVGGSQSLHIDIFPDTLFSGSYLLDSIPIIVTSILTADTVTYAMSSSFFQYWDSISAFGQAYGLTAVQDTIIIAQQYTGGSTLPYLDNSTTLYSLPNALQALNAISSDSAIDSKSKWLLLQFSLDPAVAASNNNLMVRFEYYDSLMFVKESYDTSTVQKHNCDAAVASCDSQVIAHNIDTLSSIVHNFPLNSSYSSRRLSTNIYHPDYGSNLNPKILTGKSQGLRCMINRGNFIDSCNKHFPGVKISNDNSQYNEQYYVPYAEVSFDIAGDSSYGEGKSRMLNIVMESGLDTTPQSSEYETAMMVNLGQVSSSYFIIYKEFINNVLDTLRVQYIRSPDSLRYELVFKFSNNSSQNDTLNVVLNQSFTYRLNYQESSDNFSPHWWQIKADTSKVQLNYFHESLHQQEASTLNNFGVSRQSHYVIGSDTLVLRSTHGVQMLLNRGAANTGFFHTFLLQPQLNAGLDTMGVNVGRPVFGQIPFSLTNGQIIARFKVYLYKL